MHTPSMRVSLLSLGATLLMTLATGCSPSTPSLGTLGPAERFRLAMEDLEDEDFKEAQEKFQTIILQDPNSEYADDAQFYLAETYYRDGDYRLAAFNYNRLRTQFPNSPLYREALFRSGEAYRLSAPGFERDQTDTRNAIKVFEMYVNAYGTDSLGMLAKERVRQLNSVLAHKEYAIAEQYWKLEAYEAALIYYEKVIADYPNSDFYDPAISGRNEALRMLNRTGGDDRTVGGGSPSPGTTPRQPVQMERELDGP